MAKTLPHAHSLTLHDSAECTPTQADEEAAARALHHFLRSLPTTEEAVLDFIVSSSSPSSFGVAHHPYLRAALDYCSDVMTLLENIEELTIYWHEKLRGGSVIHQRTVRRLCRQFYSASRIVLAL